MLKRRDSVLFEGLKANLATGLRRFIMSIFKDFKIGREQYLEFQTHVLGAFNHRGVTAFAKGKDSFTSAVTINGPASVHNSTIDAW
jgi:hypothetical protein